MTLRYFNWSRNTTFIYTDDFYQNVGPAIDDDIESPIDVFGCIFEDSSVKHIVSQTNLYASQKGVNFQQTNEKEIKIFLAINLLGIKKYPSYKDVWSSSPLLRDTYITSLMSRNRFSWLFSNIHVNDNTKATKKGEQNYDKLYKVRPFLNFLSMTFKKCYMPTKIQSIDESMIWFKGRSVFKIYMPPKPIKWGYKVWIRANENGYISEF